MTAISVKVPKASLVAALQATLDAEKALPSWDDYQKASQAANQKYKNELDKWGTQVAKVIARGGATVTQVWNNEVRFNTGNLELPATPEQDRFVMASQDANKIKQLENAIKLLNMSQEEFVNANTYKSVVAYL